MKAVIFHRNGGPGKLEFTDFQTPVPGPGEMLARLLATRLNYLDLWVRNGWPGIWLAYSHIPGADEQNYTQYRMKFTSDIRYLEKETHISNETS
jgi:hypothetical protein